MGDHTGDLAGLTQKWDVNCFGGSTERWNIGPGEKRKSLLSSKPFNLGSPNSALGVLPGSRGRQPPPQRPSADSGRQGPFPNAGGSYQQFPHRKLVLWGSAFRPSLKCPETSLGLGGVISRYSPARG